MSCSLDRPMTRRRFLAMAGAVAAGMGALPRWIARACAAADSSRRVLVVLFQRGGADGLNIAAPFSDPFYAPARPALALPAPVKGAAAIDLDGRFALHPRLSALLPLWRERRLALVHAAGSPDPSRSHFEAQDFMESGTPGSGSTEAGWLNRALSAGGFPPRAMTALAVASHVPKTLRGPFPAVVANRVDSLRVDDPLFESFEAVYDEAQDSVLSGPARAVKEASRWLQGVPKFDAADFEAQGYPRRRSAYHRINQDLYDVARLIRARRGLRVAFVEMEGWDHHYDEGSTGGLLAERLEELGGALAAFFRQLGEDAEDVLLVTMTEFGRALHQNGTGGTDHGHASVMMALGGGVRGGKVYGRWPGLEPENLFEGRDLQVTTDFRAVLSEALAGHLGIQDLSEVFPGGPWPGLGLLGPR